MATLHHRARQLLAGCAWLLVAGCAIRGATDLPVTDTFTASGCVEIAGYAGDAMEPFIEPKRGDLLFNNRNSPPELTDLHWARRIDAAHFQYVGLVDGANSNALDGVPSVDESGTFYFVSTRSYGETLASLYSGRWGNGVVTDVALVPGIARERRGFLIFDAEISRDGDSLFYVDGRFDGGEAPASADIVLAHHIRGQFVRDPNSDVLLGSVNTPALEYAPAISADRRELFFTRLDRHARTIGIYRTVRSGAGQPFGPPERVAAADGFVEGPALSPDGDVLYFHRLDDERYHICKADRVKGASVAGRGVPAR